MSQSQIIRETFEKNGGIFKLIPTFVPRNNSQPGKRLRLHPDDYFALGTARGPMKERWFSSVIQAANGPLAAPDEGMSYVPLFHHLHLDFDAAARIGWQGKPEAYYFPRQYNNYPGRFPVTYFGFDPDCTKEEVRERLLQYKTGDNRITELSRAYRIELGTGWYTPPGVVHAPGSYLTYEPQWNSDVNSVFENVASGEVYDIKNLVERLPEEEQDDVDAVMNLMDWEANVDPHYKKHYFRPPVMDSKEDGVYEEKWIAYGNPYVGAKELTVYPGQTVTIKDSGAYGCILTQGFGTIGGYQCETAGMLRFGQLSADEFFVGEKAATAGVKITNNSICEPLVILKHFGPNHPEMPQVSMD